MSKKEKINLQYSSDMEAINSELAAAMDALDATVQRVDELLRSIVPPPPPSMQAGKTTPAADTSGATENPSAAPESNG